MESKALEIAKKAHSGQFDKGGRPYIEHPMYVSSQFQDETLRTVALLHDVVEDSDYSFQDLEKEGFDKMIIDAVVAITKLEKETYSNYIIRLKNNKLARQVKIVDLKHNMQLNRISNPTKKDFCRIEKYKEALGVLLSEEN